jgi:phosphoenolpyruvate-protein kinase (PTS system EI component)
VAALALKGLGIRSLSMTPASISAVKRAIRGASLAELEERARRALDDPSAEAVRARFYGLTQESQSRIASA